MAEVAQQKRLRLGDLLVAQQLISPDQLDMALKEQKTSGRKLGKLLVDLGFIAEDDLLQLLANQLQIPFISLQKYSFDHALVALLPESLARRFRALVLKEEVLPSGEKALRVAMSDPMDLTAVDELQRRLARTVLTAVVRESDLGVALDSLYEKKNDIAELAGKLDDDLRSSASELDSLLRVDNIQDAPVARLLKSIFESAMSQKASDIHIEPEETVLRIRMRVDGQLNEQVMNETRIAPALVLKLKIMSGLDISEKRLPQDGRFNIQIQGKAIDVRISTLPTPFGEAVVMRLLDQSNGMMSMEGLGMPADIVEKVRFLMRRPKGLILVTGPTGSGKTTLLYAALNEINTPDRKIITAEDPIEYRLPRITQVQVNSKIDLSFSRILRTALRQDPDIMLVGEIRDLETAEIAMRASMTGHLVLATLHTNDAVSTVLRLADMGVPYFLMASALRAVVAQRLLRRVCRYCKQERALTPDEHEWLQGSMKRVIAADTKVMEGAGCHYCNRTGYSGRIGVYELLDLSPEKLEPLHHENYAGFKQLVMNDGSFRSLLESAWISAEAGVTSLAEVMALADE